MKFFAVVLVGIVLDVAVVFEFVMIVKIFAEFRPTFLGVILIGEVLACFVLNDSGVSLCFCMHDR